MTETRELTERARSGDAHAFAQLYELIYKDLYRFALYTLHHVQDAEDAVSETVTDAFAQIGTLRDADAFRPWMFRILTAKCSRRIRQYMNPETELSEELASSAPEPGEHMDVRQAFSSLPALDRLILSMTLFAGYTSQEAGTLLELNPNTVRSRQSRALRKMEQMLSAAGDAVGCAGRP